MDRVARSVLCVAKIHDFRDGSVANRLVCLTAFVGVEERSTKKRTNVFRQFRVTSNRGFDIVPATFGIVTLWPVGSVHRPRVV